MKGAMKIPMRGLFTVCTLALVPLMLAGCSGGSGVDGFGGFLAAIIVYIVMELIVHFILGLFGIKGLIPVVVTFIVMLLSGRYAFWMLILVAVASRLIVWLIISLIHRLRYGSRSGEDAYR